MTDFKVIATGSAGNCYLLQAGEEILILDAGIPIKDIISAVNPNISKVVGCLITHEHKDHSRAAKELGERGVSLYSHNETFKHKNLNVEGTNIQEGKTYEIGSFKVTPFNAVHDAEHPLGFFIYHKEIGMCLFATDTKYINAFNTQVNHMFIEANYMDSLTNKKNIITYKRISYHHNIDIATLYVAKTCTENLKTVCMLHLSNDHSNEAEFIRMMSDVVPKNVKVYAARNGMKINL